MFLFLILLYVNINILINFVYICGEFFFNEDGNGL